MDKIQSVSNVLQYNCNTLTTANTRRAARVLDLAATVRSALEAVLIQNILHHLVHQMHCNTRAAGAEWMAERNSTTAYIEQLHRYLQRALTGNRLWRECLVNLKSHVFCK